MSLELTKADLLKAHTDALVVVYSRPENLAVMGEVAAQSIANLFELLSPAAAAELLDKSEIVLRRNHKEWGLDKSVAFGREGERFFLSQIISAARAKVIAGSRAPGGKVTHFPQNKSNPAPSAPSQKAS